MADRVLLRWGALCGIAGAVLLAVFNALHPRSDQSGIRAELEMVRDTDLWLLIHAGLVLAFILIFLGTAAVLFSLPETVSSWARLAFVASAVGGAIAVITFAIDGWAMKEVADAWASGSGAAKDSAFAAARGVGAVSFAAFSATVAIGAGVAPLLFGLALQRAQTFPSWIATLAIVGGAVCVVVGLVQLVAGPSVILTNVIFTIGAVLVTIAIGAASWVLYRMVGAPMAVSVSR